MSGPEPARKTRSAAELVAERDFLLARVPGDASWVGLSSQALVMAAINGDPMPSSFDWPSDEHDLARCEATLRRAPAHLQVILRPWVERYRRHVSEGGLYCRGCDNSIGHNATTRELCRSCWAERHPDKPWFGRMLSEDEAHA